jgi:hypothetical protein
MNPDQKLALQKMMTENDVLETTDQIRTLKHSAQIREEVKLLRSLKRKHAKLSEHDPAEFDSICTAECAFLFSNYTDIFNKVKKDELDFGILDQFLRVLGRIESGDIDQHEGSFEVGKLLKKLYIDSALRKSEHLDEASGEARPVRREAKAISWRQYKMTKV